LPSNVKLIYLFANPLNIVISAHRTINQWGKDHHMHLCSNLFEENNSVFYKDTLLLHRNFEAWYRPQGFGFISVKYESLYENRTIETLSDFLGFHLKLPPFCKRESDYSNHPMKDQLMRVYADLHYKIEKAEKVKIWRKTSK